MFRQLIFRTLLAAATLVLLLIPQISANNNLQKAQFHRAKKPVALETKAKQFLKQRNSETARVWLFFTDKGVNNQAELAQKAAGLEISEKNKSRRAKTGINSIVLADLPVRSDYVDRARLMGAKLRRVSRWLNAASYDIPIDQLSKFEALPFVAEIRPVARYKNTGLIDSAEKESIFTSNDNESGLADVLDYGYAYEQVAQINVPAMHQKGYTGQGVTLAILDTGFRKSHEAFANHYLEGRVLAEYDFINDDANTANQAGDVSTQWGHGTEVWSVTGGYMPGTLVGPAYKANFLLAKTEDNAGEYQGEEDNWVAAMEWADSLGADVLTSSLGYLDWYTISDYDGVTAVTTIAANTAVDLGIVVCISMGNEGASATSLTPPADAFDIISVGAVKLTGYIASFSSRGPTFDGRTKPEVCALGVDDACANYTADNTYTYSNGTSFACPLVAGIACLLVEAHPTFSPQLIRQSLMETASRADAPDNTYGWGIANGNAALSWGLTINADVQIAQAPVEVNFTGESSAFLNASSWLWNFGDGTTSTLQNPTHTYNEPGAYTVSAEVATDYGPFTFEQQGFVLALGDTLWFEADTAISGTSTAVSVFLRNSQPLEEILIPFKYFDYPHISFDSVTRGERTVAFEYLSPTLWDSWSRRYAYLLRADNGGGTLPLEAGSGEIMKIYFSVASGEVDGTTYLIDTLYDPQINITSQYLVYQPEAYGGSITVSTFIRGDCTGDEQIDVEDLVYLIDYQFRSGPATDPVEVMDIDGSGVLDIEDVVYMVDFQFRDGPPPPQ